MSGLGLFLTVSALLVIGPVSTAGAAVVVAPPNDVALSIGAAGGSGSATSSPLQFGIGDAPLAGFPTAGPTYGALSTGDVTAADTPNDSAGTSTGFGGTDPARGTANDPVTLRADFVVPEGQSCLQLDYKFFSEEFPEFVNAGFNDAFIAELDSSTWSVNPDPVTFTTKLSAPGDFAAGYGDQVAVDTVGPTIVSEAQAVGTTYDAATSTLTAKTPVTPGAHSVYLSVFDAGDGIYDSTVFADNLRFTADPPSACKPPDLFNGAVGVSSTAKKVKFKGKTGSFPLSCLLPVEATDPCVGKANLSAVLAGNIGSNRTLARAKSSKIAKGKYSIAPATTGAMKLKLTKKGKRLLAKKGGAKGKVKVTNTINGVSQSFKVKIKG
ncbi:MAG: choice-of-anchor L domain-containing protein [Solirubrobacterales bacterium]